MQHSLVGELIHWSAEHGLICDLAEDGNIAIFSPDHKHRYILTRHVGPSKQVLAGIGLNPSTATAFIDDPTIRRFRGFASTWNCGLYVMLNAYAWRDTFPNRMFEASKDKHDIVGEHNNAAIRFVLSRLSGGIPLAAWGAHVKKDRSTALLQIARELGVSLQCLGTNKDGSPKHLLYLAKSTALSPWPSALSSFAEMTDNQLEKASVEAKRYALEYAALGIRSADNDAMRWFDRVRQYQAELVKRAHSVR